jgi:hypothetical protein
MLWQYFEQLDGGADASVVDSSLFSSKELNSSRLKLSRILRDGGSTVE